MSERGLADWQRLDAAYHLHPFTDHRQLAERGTRLIERAAGVYLYEAGGRRLLDGMSGLWCVAMGYGQERLIEAAVRQLRELPYYNSFFQCTTPPAIELAALLAELTPPQFRHVFFTGSGSEANDTFVRMARRYWDLQGQPQRKVIISRWNAYHGSTVAGASLGGMKTMHSQGGLPIPDIVHIQQPYWFECGGDLDPEAFGLAAARALEAKILEIGPERVAAFIGEPVQGAGGVIVPPASYWPEVQRIIDRYGILFCSDEVICGFGRTGAWFGCEYYGTRPDFLTLAKAMTSGYQPLGALMVADRVAEVLIEKGGEFFHGFTYSGHPVACAVAIANLQLMRERDIVRRVRDEIGPYWQRRFATLGEHPLVGEVRTLGLFGALELVADKAQRRLFADRGAVGTRARDLMVQNGLVMRAVWDTLIAAPPLVISREQVDELIDIAARTLDELQQELRAAGKTS
ncbi:MAG: aspartate aminotransferase family protein [Steroidobacteraceae bacterium]|nr:aspartate aminotransferase family protein [Steroidobacteraceae bacterium]MDW8258862.1 aspartate aminotransferase family protein [Gammaproteobacteria bacterium]